MLGINLFVVFVLVHVCACVYDVHGAYVCVRACVYVHVCMCMCGMYMCVCMHTCKHMHMYMHVCMSGA